VAGGARQSDEISYLVKRNVAARAAVGLWDGGQVPFGYRRSTRTGHLEIEPSEKKTIILATEKLLAGEKLSVVVRYLNDKGMKTRSGKPWQRTALRSLLLRPTLAGLRQHQPRIKHTIKPHPRSPATMTKAVWKPILTTQQHAALRALLLSEDRRTTPVGGGRARKFLAVGYISCGRCGAKVRAKTGQSRGKPYTYYVCSECSVRRDRDKVDEFIAGAVVKRLSGRAPYLAAVSETDAVRVQVERDKLREARLRTAEKAARGTIDEDEWFAFRTVLDEQDAALKERLDAITKPLEVEPEDPTVLRRAWDVADLEQKRDMIHRSGLTFRLDPVGRGHRKPDTPSG
jgi:site-specific DNA recombinase